MGRSVRRALTPPGRPGSGWAGAPGLAAIRFFVSLWLGAAALAASATVSAAEFALQTNEDYVDAVLAEAEFDVDDVDAVLDRVFQALPDEVTVYPTENYYYFKFLHRGVPYAGNFRLDAADRDRGVIHFAYFSENRPGLEQRLSRHVAYTAATGLAVAKTAELTYAVTRKGRTISFRLNDLRHVRPEPGAIPAGETYVGPVFDESAVRLFLMWNPRLEMFLYVLDESLASEEQVPSEVSPQIRIGARTGFAYYRDRYLGRWLLVGVRADEVALNTYFDGPFDQLPDNFIEGETLRTALVRLSPEVEGEIDRFGNSRDLSGRMLVDPYVLYREASELFVFDQCAAAAVDEDAYYLCFATGQTR